MNKKIITIVVGVVLIGASFYGGMVYGQSKSSATAQGFRAGNFAGNVNGARAGARAGAGAAGGEILSKDATGVTIKLQNGSTKIVLISGSTPIMKTVLGASTDLKIGEQINAVGTANSDGSITAESIQIRQATSTRPLGQ